MDSELIQKLLAKVAALEEELVLYKNKYEQAIEAYDCLLQQYKELQRYRFGKRSEKQHSGELPKDEGAELETGAGKDNGTGATTENETSTEK